MNLGYISHNTLFGQTGYHLSKQSRIVTVKPLALYTQSWSLVRTQAGLSSISLWQKSSFTCTSHEAYTHQVRALSSDILGISISSPLPKQSASTGRARMNSDIDSALPFSSPSQSFLVMSNNLRDLTQMEGKGMADL